MTTAAIGAAAAGSGPAAADSAADSGSGVGDSGGSGPRRVQRSRAPGARLEPGAVVVDRTGQWGNPYPVGEYGQRGAVRRHRADLLAGTLVNTRGEPVTIADVRQELAGRVLACWCSLDEACHADTLLLVANATPADLAALTDQAQNRDGGA